LTKFSARTITKTKGKNLRNSSHNMIHQYSETLFTEKLSVDKC